MGWTEIGKASVRSMVMSIARELIPGWSLEILFADSIEATGGALAHCVSQPRREKASITIAPHPPDEKLAETVAHELGHAWISPLTELIEPSQAAITIEEQLIERWSKFAAGHPSLVGALARVMRSPRAGSAMMRKRIAALATGRLGKGKRRMMTKEQAQKALDALEADDAEAAKTVLREMIASMIAEGDGGTETVETAKEDEPKVVQPMREDEVPPAMRAEYRRARAAGSMLLADTIRTRLHTMRTVDGVELDETTTKDLMSCKTIEQFDRESRIVARMATKPTEQRRARSRVEPDASDVNGAPSLESLKAEGIPDGVAKHIRAQFEVSKDLGNAALTVSRKYRKAGSNG